MGVESRDVEPEVVTYINGGNLEWGSPDSLQFLSKVLLKESSLVHDEVFQLKCDVCVLSVIYIPLHAA